MELTKQICSLDLSKRLKELGVKQESLFFYKYKDDDKHYETKEYELCEEEGEFCHHDFRQENYISTFTVAELGEMLPYKIKDKECYLIIEKDQNNNGTDHWRVFYEELGGERTCTEMGDSLADALASMFIHLLESKLITV